MVPTNHALDRSGQAPMTTDQITEIIMPWSLVDELGLKEVDFLIQCGLRIHKKLIVVVILVELEASYFSNVVYQAASVGGFMP